MFYYLGSSSAVRCSYCDHELENIRALCKFATLSGSDADISKECLRKAQAHVHAHVRLEGHASASMQAGGYLPRDSDLLNIRSTIP
jgi:predicted amidophosphoribosyltransferase